MWPNHLLFYGDFIYLTNSGDNNIEIYNESTFEFIDEIYLGTGSNPWMIIPAEDTGKGYVPNFVAGTVSVIDFQTSEVTGTVEVGKGPEGGVYQNGKIYICNTAWNYQSFDFDEGTVSVIDCADDTVVNTISVGKNPQSAVAFPDLEEVHVICTGTNGGDDADDGLVYIIDTASDTVTEIIDIGGSPGGGAGGIDAAAETLYLTGVGGLQSYNYVTKEVLHGSSDYILQGPDPSSDFFSSVLVDQREGLIYVCHFSDDTIVVLDLDDYSEVKEIQGSDGAQLLYLFEE
jgi:YVTN family beta-propeller protein